MIRKTILGVAAATALVASASAASAGVHINLGFGGYGYAPVYGGYYGGHYGCDRVFVGYKKIWTYYGWVKKPIYRKVCGYGY